MASNESDKIGKAQRIFRIEAAIRSPYFLSRKKRFVAVVIGRSMAIAAP